MQLKFAVSAAVAMLIASAAPQSYAQKGKKKDSQELVPDSINRQFQWEDKVVGPKDKGIDHKKIAAMQEQARREDEAKKKEPQPKKAERAAGVDAPASASLPTMDIEKPAPVAAKKSVKRAAYAEPPKQRDALDNLLTQETGKSEGYSDRGSSNGLGAILASDDKPATHSARPAVKRGKKPVRRRHN